MSLRMADAISANNLPPGFDAYGGYDDGRWPDYQAIANEHPTAHLVEFTVVLADRGDHLDVEQGDASPDQAPTYVNRRTAAGIWRPGLYGSIDSAMPLIVQALDRAQIARAWYRLLSAHYDASLGQHICGPNTCGSPIQCDGTQWIDHGAYDESILDDSYFLGPPSPILAPPIGDPMYDPNAVTAFISCADAGFAGKPAGAGYKLLANGGVDTINGADFCGSYYTLDPADRIGQPGVEVPFIAITPRENGQPGFVIRRTNRAYYELGPDIPQHQ